MKIIDFFKNLFGFKKEEECIEDIMGKVNDEFDLVPELNKLDEEKIQEMKNLIDPNKDTILLIDDNEGLLSFLKDDFEYYVEQGYLKPDEKNILIISGQLAAFYLERLYEELGDELKITDAIIDITLGGVMAKDGKHVKYNGVDIFEMIYKHNPNLRFIFYTGNNLNPYIKSNRLLIEKFKGIYKDDIMNYVLFKTSMNMDERRKKVAQVFFNK